MTLTYPLSLPYSRFVSSRFRLVPIVARNRVGSGASFAREIAPAYWQADLRTVPHNETEFGRWMAFFDALRGGSKSCLLFDPHRCFPIRHSGFTGTGTLAAISSIRQVSVSGLPGGFVLTAGDYIGFERGGRYSLHRVVQDSTAIGGMVSVAIEPPLPPHFVAGSLVRLNRPVGEFMIDSFDGERRAGKKPVSFSATSRVA
ncbi:MAG: hypothetical protein KIS86_15000 [Devosia sp.]|nr:hypothetical protein [Devosia sp.]